MKWTLRLALICSVLWAAAADQPYDFRTSPAYRALSPPDRQRLEQVCRDLVLLWGALDMYADEHNGNPPESLDTLVPRFLAELPADPFAPGPKDPGRYVLSKGGLGYRFMKGAPGNRAWSIASVGLPDFPFLAERGNIGLYRCKGLWISGVNPVVGPVFNADGAASGVKR